MNSKFSQGMTLTELFVVVGILSILAGLSIPTFRFFQKESDLNNSVEEIINSLRLAQNKTLASEGASQWGVYFTTSTSPNQYILFKGSAYNLRDAAFDETHKLPKSIEISSTTLPATEVVFKRITGNASSSGSLSLRLKTDITKTKTIYIEQAGQVGLITSNPKDTSRIKDSRHVHFDYSRQISTSTEKLLLTFTYNSSVTTQEIIIANNLKDGQIYWVGEVNAGGTIQKLKIHTHRLNDLILGSQFCIHRDRRYNDKALKIDINDAPDPDSGTLIEYSADGLTTTSTSFFVTNSQWQ